MTKIVPVLLAGGAGTRLWPVSRDALPKQFLPLVGERSTYQDTLLRVAEGDLFAPPIVITNADFRFFARRQAETLGIEATVVIEPMRRDSGPALAAAAALAKSRDPNAVVLALAADHVILDVEEFRATCLAGLKAAEAGHIVTFGIKPTSPKTNYGYIRRGKPAGVGRRLSRLRRSWKSQTRRQRRATSPRAICGIPATSCSAPMCCWRSLRATSRPWPPRSHAAVAGASDDLGFVRLEPAAFAGAPQKSIDYAVMEKTDRAAVVSGDFRWSDIGSWDAIFDVAERDKSGNAVHGVVVTADAQELRHPFRRPAHSGAWRARTSWWYRRPTPSW